MKNCFAWPMKLKRIKMLQRLKRKHGTSRRALQTVVFANYLQGPMVICLEVQTTISCTVTRDQNRIGENSKPNHTKK